MSDQTPFDELKAESTRQILDQYDTPAELSDSWQDLVANLADLKVQVDQLQAANQAGFQALARQGIQLGGPDTLNLTVRLEALAQHLLGDDTDPRRLAYELLIQEKFAALIANAQAQAARAKLLAPSNGQVPPPGLLRG